MQKGEDACELKCTRTVKQQHAFGIYVISAAHVMQHNINIAMCFKSHHVLSGRERDSKAVPSWSAITMTVSNFRSICQV